MFPLDGSVIRRLASLHRLRAGYRSPASSVLSRRSDFLPPIPRRFVSSLRGTTHLCAWPGSGELLFAGSSSVLRRCLNPLPAFRSRGDGWISQVPWQPLLANMPCSSTPADRVHQASSMPSMLPSVCFTTSAPHLGPFRGLSHTACSLAVYASQLGLLRHTPRKTRFPLTATLSGTGFSPARLLRRFPLCDSNHIVSSSSRLPWRTEWRASQRPRVGCYGELGCGSQTVRPALHTWARASAVV